MLLARRTFLFGGALCSAANAAVSPISAPPVLRTRLRRVSQGELDAAIDAHKAWLDDDSQGERAVFAKYDLSGLDLHSHEDVLIDLRGSDFTGADLTGVTGNLVGFNHASLHGARLSWSRLKKPGFLQASLRNARCDHVIWGWDSRMTPDPAWLDAGEGAALHHVDAGRSDFSGAIIRGLFVDCKFLLSNLCEADLSYSVFAGGSACSTSFFKANLSRARFAHTIIKGARFSTDMCEGVDFTGAQIGYGVKPPAGANVGKWQFEG